MQDASRTGNIIHSAHPVGDDTALQIPVAQQNRKS